MNMKWIKRGLLCLMIVLIAAAGMAFARYQHTAISTTLSAVFAALMNITVRRSRQSGVARATCPD